MLTMLRFDGEIWEIAPGEGTDETTVKARKARPKKGHPEEQHDQKAIDAGVTHIQTSYGGGLYHEIRRIK